jgi:hypothetical protein
MMTGLLKVGRVVSWQKGARSAQGTGQKNESGVTIVTQLILAFGHADIQVAQKICKGRARATRGKQDVVR